MIYIIRFLSPLTIALSVVFMVFLVLNQFNPTMYFLTHPLSQSLLWAFCVSVLVCTVYRIIEERKNK